MPSVPVCQCGLCAGSNLDLGSGSEHEPELLAQGHGTARLHGAGGRWEVGGRDVDIRHRTSDIRQETTLYAVDGRHLPGFKRTESVLVCPRWRMEARCYYPMSGHWALGTGHWGSSGSGVTLPCARLFFFHPSLPPL